MNISVLYFSKSGHTAAMAQEIAKGCCESGANAKAFSIDNIDADFLNSSKAVIFGTPTYYANTCWQIKKCLMNQAQ